MSKRSGSNFTSASGFRSAIGESKLDSEHIDLSLAELVKDHGFDTFGVVNTSKISNFEKELNNFLDLQHHGEMRWMKERSHLRSDPKKLWSDVKSIIVLGNNYNDSCNSLELLSYRDKGIISVYARNEDYHSVIKKKLKKLSFKISEVINCDFKYFILLYFL